MSGKDHGLLTPIHAEIHIFGTLFRYKLDKKTRFFQARISIKNKIGVKKKTCMHICL